MTPALHFRFCPRCAAPRGDDVGREPLRCAACGFVYYFNPCVAAAALVLRPDGRGLFIRRAHDPARGKLAFPGGFVDAHETAEAALRREVREEVGLEVEGIEFLGSHPNDYVYRDVSYPVLDFFFVAQACAPERARALDAVAGLEWLDPATVPLEALAFPSLRAALADFRRRPRRDATERPAG